MRKTVSIIGDSEASEDEMRFAERLGEELAKRGYVIVCGGRTGIMEAVAKGAKKAGGLTIGILPSTRKSEANKYIDIAIPTGLGWARNVIVILAGDVVVAIGGRSGTLSEIAYAWMHNKPIIAVVGFGGWSQRLAGKRIDDRREDSIIPVKSVEEAVSAVEKLLG